jgi:PP-loop superfamily ATP-utilizing enzyme
MATKTYKRDAIFADLGDFCYLSTKDAYIEITEWTNGEGYDIIINSHQSDTFSITRGELRAIKKLVKQLDKKD